MSEAALSFHFIKNCLVFPSAKFIDEWSFQAAKTSASSSFTREIHSDFFAVLVKSCCSILRSGESESEQQQGRRAAKTPGASRGVGQLKHQGRPL